MEKLSGNPRVLVASGGLLLSLAFPPLNLIPLIWVALVPWFWSLYSADAKSAWRLSYLFGLVFSVAEFHGIYGLTMQWTHSFWLALVPWFVFAAAMALYFAVIGWLTQRCITANRLWMVPFVWVGLELVRSYIPIFAFPWALLAVPLCRYPALIQPAHFGTIYLLAAWVVTVNLALTLLVRKSRTLETKLFCGVAALLPLPSLAMYESPRQTHPLPVTIGQIGFDIAFHEGLDTDRKIDQVVAQSIQTAKENHSRLLLLGEDITSGRPNGQWFGVPLQRSIPTIFGAHRAAVDKNSYQSAIGFDGAWHTVDKVHLMLFSETVPFKNVLPLAKWFDLPSEGLTPSQNGVQTMTVAGVKVGPLLCFDSLFPDLSCRLVGEGAEFLNILSDDDWFMSSSAPEQLRAATIWRAVETGLPVARAASMGYSLACDGKGRVLAEAPLAKTMAFPVELPIPNGQPFAAELPLFPASCMVVTLWALIAPKAGPRCWPPQTPSP